MKQNRLISGRVPVLNPSEVSSDRYEFLDLKSAEPNLGVGADGAVLTTDTSGNRIWTTDPSFQNLDVVNNLTANRIYTDNLLFANGNPYISGSVPVNNNTNIYNGVATVTTDVTLVDTMPLSGNSTVRWTIGSQDTINNRFKSATIDSINDGTTAYYNEYGVVLSDNTYEVAVFTSNISGGNINLYAIGESANVAVVFQRVALGTSTVPGYVPAGRDGRDGYNGYTGSAGGVSVVVNSFTGNGTGTTYLLTSAPLNVNQTIVSVGGILQPKSTYSVSGTILTFSSAPGSSVPIEVTTFASAAASGGGAGYTGSAGSFSGTTSQAIVTTNTTASTSKTTGALRVAGGAGIGGNLYIGGTTYITGDLLPTSNNTVNIGSATQRFGTLYLAANTIDLGGTTITTAPTGELVFTTQAGNVSLSPNTISFLSTVANTATPTGDLSLSGTFTGDKVYAGSYFYSNGAAFTGGLGYTGSRGIQGTQGTTGYAGSSGSNGYTGSRGDTGLGFSIAKSYTSVALLTADTNPTGIVTGQFAIIETGDTNNAENSRLYLWNGSSYSYVSDLSGAQGIIGPTGAVGYTGSAGTNGYTGSAGTNGYTGSIGSTGATGATGPIGYTGSLGYTGSAGASGAAGTNGYTGSVGATGATGIGATGATGPSGGLGYTGSAGAAGAAGGGYINLVMAGTITPPITGTARFYPPASMTINTVYANLGSNPLGGNLNFVIKKNGTNIGTTFALSSALMTPVSVNVALTTSDYLTLDVSGSSSNDLQVRLKYI